MYIRIKCIYSIRTLSNAICYTLRMNAPYLLHIFLFISINFFTARQMWSHHLLLLMLISHLSVNCGSLLMTYYNKFIHTVKHNVCVFLFTTI